MLTVQPWVINSQCRTTWIRGKQQVRSWCVSDKPSLVVETVTLPPWKLLFFSFSLIPNPQHDVRLILAADDTEYDILVMKKALIHTYYSSQKHELHTNPNLTSWLVTVTAQTCYTCIQFMHSPGTFWSTLMFIWHTFIFSNGQIPQVGRVWQLICILHNHHPVLRITYDILCFV